MLRQRGETPTSDLEAARTRLAARRSGVAEEEAEATAETVREDPPVYLLGGAVPDAVASVVAGLLPVALFAYPFLYRLPSVVTGALVIAALVVYIADWVAFFAMLRGFRTARIALALTLCLFTLIAMLLLGVVAYGLMFPASKIVDFNASPWLFALPVIGLFALQVVAIVQAVRRR